MSDTQQPTDRPATQPDRTWLWRVRLFGGPVLVDRDGHETRHFRSQKVRAMLAYLALHLGNSCPREVMYEALINADLMPR